MHPEKKRGAVAHKRVDAPLVKAGGLWIPTYLSGFPKGKEHLVL
jgi:hypothetical protein